MSAADLTHAQAIAQGQEWIRAGWVWRPGQVALVAGPVKVQAGAFVEVQRPDARAHLVLAVDTGMLPMLLRVVALDVDESEEPRWAQAAELVPDVRDPGFIGHALAQVHAAWSEYWFDFSVDTTGAPGRGTTADSSPPAVSSQAGTRTDSLCRPEEAVPRGRSHLRTRQHERRRAVPTVRPRSR